MSRLKTLILSLSLLAGAAAPALAHEEFAFQPRARTGKVARLEQHLERLRTEEIVRLEQYLAALSAAERERLEEKLWRDGAHGGSAERQRAWLLEKQQARAVREHAYLASKQQTRDRQARAERRDSRGSFRDRTVSFDRTRRNFDPRFDSY